MSVIQVQLPEQIQQVIDRQVAAGLVASRSEFLVEAARRFVEDIALEDEIAAETNAGIADAEAGRFVIIATPEDAAKLHERTMMRLQSRMKADQG
jgi:Arc/MetJ-type ribon-helix-helix transcriptional regulator